MAEDETPLANERTVPTPLALLPTNVAIGHNGQQGGVPALAPPPSGMPDVMAYFHAFRRHWLVSVGIGLLCAAIAGPAVWFSVSLEYTASAFIRVAMAEKTIAFQMDYADGGKERFDIYKATQQYLLTSRFVLLAALRKNPEVAKSPSIRRETEKGDPVDWLQKNLSISFPGKAELMEVSLKLEDRDEAKLLVNEVVNAYMAEVVNTERETKQKRLSELDLAVQEKERQVRSARDNLKKLGEQLGTSETETLTLKQKLALEELTTYRQELTKIQFELHRVRAELAAQEAVLKNVETAEISDMELDAVVQADPIARQLFMEQGFQQLNQLYMESTVVPGAKSSYTDRYERDHKRLADSYNARKAELVGMVRQKRRSAMELEVRKLQNAVAVLNEEEQALRQQVEAKQREAATFGKSSVDIEMLRADIRNAEFLLSTLATERDKLRIESRSTPRITLMQPADRPDVPSNSSSRLALTFLAMIATFCCPAAVIIFWDSLGKRINTCADVSKGLQLPVLGSVPMIPAKVIRNLGSPLKRYQAWQIRLTESVDGIAARLLRKAETDQSRVLMISSAAGGEGKTTLATQLALSLARAGRRTVLVDFDLRRPAFDEVFGLPLEPGVCEILREQSEIAPLVHEVATDNLAVVTAGRWDRSALALLSNGAAATIFKKLREDYDFVVVDASPILPVADARFVSQYVDAVVLSVFRDVSQAPKIQAACEILAAFGVHNVEAVVTGPNDNMYGEDVRYESTISA